MLAVLVAASALALWRLPPFHPAQLWCLPWTLAGVLYTAHLLPYRWVSGRTALLVIASTIAFVGCSLAGERLFSRLAGRVHLEDEREYRHAIRLAAVTATALVAVLLLAFVAQVAGDFGLRAALVSSQDVRGAIGEGAYSVTVKYLYFALAAIVLCSLAAAQAETRRSAIAWLLVAIVLAGTIYFSTGRSTIVVGLIAGSVAYILGSRRRISQLQFLGGFAAVTVLALAALVGGGHLIGKTWANNGFIRAVPSVFHEHRVLNELALPYQYASANIAALDVQVDAASTWGATGGCAALVEACRALARLGVDVEIVPRVRQFTADPLPWNTYTALDVPLLDGGLALTVPIIACVGLLVGLLWGVAQHRSILGIGAYAIVAPAIITAYGQFNFTAPHLVGGTLIACLAVLAARLPMRNEAPSTAPSA